MAADKAKEFFARIETDPKAKELLSGAKEPKTEEEFIGVCMKLASQTGFEVTSDEIRDAIDTMTQKRREKTAAGIQLLPDEELESATGGNCWTGEDAPDGHEMGCFITYHGYGWTKENNTWCSDKFYCDGGHYQPKVCKGTWI